MAQLHWILVANGAHARLFERRSFTEPLVEMTDWVDPAGRMSARETERAPLGQSLAGRLLMLDGRSMEWSNLRTTRNPACPVCGLSHGHIG